MYLQYLGRVQLVSVADLGGAGTHPPLFWVKKKRRKEEKSTGQAKKTKTKQNKTKMLSPLSSRSESATGHYGS